jgi:PAS domain-containing protein
MHPATRSTPGAHDGVALPLATALVGLAAALLDPRPGTLILAVLLLGLGAAGLWAALQRRRRQAAVDRVVAEHRMLRESVENNPMPYAVYDDRDRLIAWNKAYQATHAEAFRRLQSRLDRAT